MSTSHVLCTVHTPYIVRRTLYTVHCASYTHLKYTTSANYFTYSTIKLDNLPPPPRRSYLPCCTVELLSLLLCKYPLLPRFREIFSNVSRTNIPRQRGIVKYCNCNGSRCAVTIIALRRRIVIIACACARVWVRYTSSFPFPGLMVMVSDRNAYRWILYQPLVFLGGIS